MHKGFRGFLWDEILLYVTNIFDLHIFDNINDGLFKIFKNLYRNTFCFFIFSKWKKYYSLKFDDTFKIYCFALCLSESKLHKQAVFKLRSVKYAILLFSDSLFMFILTKNEKIYFSIQVSKTSFIIEYITEY